MILYPKPDSHTGTMNVNQPLVDNSNSKGYSNYFPVISGILSDR